MSSAEDQITEPELLKTISREQAATLVRSPGSTVMPPHDAQLGKKALEVLRTLTHDPKALVDHAPLGQGGMGVIRVAKQVALDRQVAVKTLKPNLGASHDIEALLAEAWMAGGLEHPNILPVYALSLDENGKPVLVMKRIEGVTWATLLHDPEEMKKHAPDRPALDEHLRVLQQVCNAVHFAHSRGVIHRDLKPENVMVGAFGEVYVVDWGIATTAGPAQQLAGTPAYMAPEMLGGAGATLSERTDVYLLGAMLFEVLAGKPPHSATSPQELFEVVRRSKPNVPADAPEELAALVRACMSVSPADRPPSALAVRKALEAFLEHQGSNTLAAQSEKRAVELRALTSQPATDRTRIDALFGECRFGLQQALVSWPGNTRARKALDEVLELMVRFELRHGSPRTAQVLLGELPTPPPTLKADVDSALAREADKDSQLRRLKELEEALDPNVGTMSRAILAVVIGAVWVVLPFAGNVLLPPAPGTELVRSAPVALLCAFVLTGVGIYAQRHRRNWTTINRQLLRIVAFAMFVQAVGCTVTYWLGFQSTPMSVALLPAFWAIVAGIVSVSIYPSVWPTSVGYLLGAIGMLIWPEHRYWVSVFPSSVLVLNALVISRAQQYHADS
ncbi:MAG: serine/threonine-protein kinase [Archangium sp.]